MDLYGRVKAATSGRWSMAVGLLVPAVILAWTAHAVWATYSPAPFSDQWDEILQWRDLRLSGLRDYLLTQHNEHRIFFPRLVFLADWRWFQARNVLNLAVIGLIQAAGAAFLLVAIEVRRGGAVRLLGAAVSLSLIFSLLQWENLFWGFQVQFVGVFVLGAWALWAFAQATRDPEALSWGWMVAALTLLVVATFNMANGLFAGFAMVAVAAVTGRGRPATLLPLATTAILLALYLRGYTSIQDHASPALTMQHPGRFLTYVCAYLGNIWWPQNVTAAAATGLIGIAGVLAMFLALIYQRTLDAGKAALFGVVLFIGMTAAMTAFGRLNFGIGQALSSRYMTPTAWFWTAQAGFWCLTLSESRGRVARAGGGAILALALFRLLSLQPLATDMIHFAHDRIVLGSSAVLGGVEDPDALLTLYPRETMIHEVLPYMASARLSLFAEPPVAVVGSHFTRGLSPGDACVGAIDVLSPAPAAPASPFLHADPTLVSDAWRAQGWGWDVAARRPFERLVMVDGGGTVRGIGLSGLRREDVKKLVRQVSSASSGWVASLDHGAPPDVIVYGVLNDGRACKIGRKAWPK